MFRRYRLIIFRNIFHLKLYFSGQPNFEKKVILFKQLLSYVHEQEIKKENKFLSKTRFPVVIWKRKRKEEIDKQLDQNANRVIGQSIVVVCSGLTSLSTIFQSYHDGVWLRQRAQCSLL